MADDRAGCRVGVGARDDLVAGADAERAQGAFERRRGRCERGGAVGLRESGDLALELLRLRTGGDPPAFQRVGHLVEFGLRDVRRGKRNASLLSQDCSLCTL